MRGEMKAEPCKFNYRDTDGIKTEIGFVVRRGAGWIVVSDKPNMMVNPRRHEMCHIRQLVKAA